MPGGNWHRCGSFSNGRQKRPGRSRSRRREIEGVDVGEGVYLFYLRLVLLPHHLVRRGPSGRRSMVEKASADGDFLMHLFYRFLRLRNLPCNIIRTLILKVFQACVLLVYSIS